MDETGTIPKWKAGVACTFLSAKRAFDAVHALCAAGLNRAWVGFFRSPPGRDSTAVLDSEWEGDAQTTSGVFTLHDGREQSLQDALRCRGVPASEIQYFKRTLPPRAIVLIVDADARLDEARAVLAGCGGRLASMRG